MAKRGRTGVLSLGGGTLTQQLLDIYKPIKKIQICYIHANFDECWKRLHLEGSEPRPLIKLGKGELHRVYEERQLVFQQIEWKLQNSIGTDITNLAKLFWSRV